MKEYQVSDLFFTRWEDLRPAQIITLIELTDALRLVKPGTREQGLIIINILRTIRKKPQLVEKITVEQAVDIFNDIAFFRRNPDGSFATPWYYFPIPGFVVNDFKFVAPTRSDLPLFYLTFQQLVYADSAFSAFCVLNHKLNGNPADRSLQADTDAALNSLISVLYTLPDEFDIADQEVRARLVPLSLNIAKRSLILHTYANIRGFITARCPTLFPVHKAEAAEQEPTFTGPMWMNLRYDLAETEAFKGFEVASNTRIYDALDYLEKKSIEATKLKPHGTA